MRITLDIEDDVFHAVKVRARREHRTIGQVMSELTRAGLTAEAQLSTHFTEAVCGFRPFPSRGGMVTNELIDALRGDDAH